MAVRIRMKQFGRRHQPCYRVCAIDGRKQRDGRVLEELGTYDPMVPEVDARAVLLGDRIRYWLSVGAQPSDKVRVLIKKYGAEGTHLESQKAALDRLAQRRRAPQPTLAVAKPQEQEPAAEQPAAEQPAAEQPAAEQPAAEQPAAEQPAAEQPAAEQPAAEQPAEAEEKQE